MFTVSEVSYPQPTGCMQPRVAMNGAQHKTVNLLNTLWDFFVWLCVTMYLLCGPRHLFFFQCGSETPKGIPPGNDMLTFAVRYPSKRKKGGYFHFQEDRADGEGPGEKWMWLWKGSLGDAWGGRLLWTLTEAMLTSGWGVLSCNAAGNYQEEKMCTRYMESLCIISYNCLGVSKICN